MDVSYAKIGRVLNMPPTRLVVLSFLTLITIGTLLLNLPAASRSGESIGFLDALFTATSASCVTGLVVVDTFNHWSFFGQLVILLLFQIGGLGIVTFATFFSILLGRKIGLKGMLIAQESLNYYNFQDIAHLVKKIIIFVFSLESLGTLLLSMYFIPRYGIHGLYMSIFHSVSAFCNAGFDITGDMNSFMGYNSNPLILYTLMFLVVVGGLGFIVWNDIYEYRKNKTLLLHTKVVLIVTGCLLIAGTVLIFAFEFKNTETMGNLSLFSKVNAALFHSIVPRTAGFSSLDVENFNEISKVTTIIFMFIGGAPGSTAGGIKITTFSVIIIAAISQIKGSHDTVIFRKRVPPYTINKSLAIIVLSLVAIITVTTVLLALESNPFINVLFEVASAFGTVGLSTGLTPYLHDLSKIFIIITMFLGRVGVLTFAIALTLQSGKKNVKVIYPEGKIVVG